MSPLDIVVCPRCRGSPDFVNGPHEAAGSRFGVAECDCAAYPLVGDVLVVRRDPLTQSVTEHIEAGDWSVAVFLLLNRPRWDRPARGFLGEALRRGSVDLSPVLAYLRWAARREARTRPLGDFPDSFAEGLQFANGRALAHTTYQYMLYRPFEQSFWNLHAVLPQFCEREGPVLDMAGGAGHASYLLERTTGRPAINVDVDFRNLFVYSRWLRPEGFAVQIAPSADLPFGDSTFGDVLNLDGFHYIDDQPRMAGEYERVADADGRVFLLHTHVRNAHPGSGSVRSPPAYCDLFDREGVVAPERELLTEFLRNGSASVTSVRETADNVNIVFGVDGDELTVDGERNPLSAWRGGVSVNPLYELSTDGETAVLTRRDVPDWFRDEFAFSFEHTDRRYELPTGTEPPSRLLYRGILTPFPDDYSSEAATLSSG